MGYFSNGTEGMAYEEQWCVRCAHHEGCHVWLAHLLHNSAECNKEDSILHLLIPRSKDGLSNLKCNLFIPKQTAHEKKLAADKAKYEAAMAAAKTP